MNAYKIAAEKVKSAEKKMLGVFSHRGYRKKAIFETGILDGRRENR